MSRTRKQETTQKKKRIIKFGHENEYKWTRKKCESRSRAPRTLITSLVTERNFNTSELWFGAFMALLCVCNCLTNTPYAHKMKLKDKRNRPEQEEEVVSHSCGA